LWFVVFLAGGHLAFMTGTTHLVGCPLFFLDGRKMASRKTESGMRTEHDMLGSMEIPVDALWGIHTARARRNFPVGSRPVPASLIHALGRVKQACAQANMEIGELTPEVGAAIVEAAGEVAAGVHDGGIHLDALQGGAGTSTNMAVNEWVANRALVLMGELPGRYEVVHPLNHVNLHQSTNDVYPTALRVAAIEGVRELSGALARLQGALQQREKAFADIPVMGRTEWMDAVPMTLGRIFSGLAEALGRDRWRTFKCEERLRVVNLGGTAVGTGLTAPREFIFLAVEKLRELTGFGVTRGENLVGETAHADALVEVSGILKAAAVNMQRVGGDLRWLHSRGEIHLPALQAGSSVMPGKVNPVMAEYAMQVGIQVAANDGVVAECAARGTLQIVEFLPLLAAALLESIAMLARLADQLAEHVAGIEADPAVCAAGLGSPVALLTAFVPEIGYERAVGLYEHWQASGRGDLMELLCRELGEETVERVMRAESLNRLGYPLRWRADKHEGGDGC
jgi:aspartate ammonia-lyase